jgi:hypothetical protein
VGEEIAESEQFLAVVLACHEDMVKRAERQARLRKR